MSEDSIEKFRRLVDHLRDATNSDRIRWRVGFTPDSFVATLKHGSVRLARTEEHCRDNDGVPQLYEWYELEILDEQGVCGERLSSNTTLTGDDSLAFPQQPLAELFRLVRSAAVDVNGVVDAIIGELG